MKYEIAKEKAIELGAKLLTKTEFSIKYGKPQFIPFGCDHCRKAEGESDFENILYFVVDNEKLNIWSQENGGVTVSNVNYGIIGRCKYCGSCDIESDI